MGVSMAHGRVTKLTLSSRLGKGPTGTECMHCVADTKELAPPVARGVLEYQYGSTSRFRLMDVLDVPGQ